MTLHLSRVRLQDRSEVAALAHLLVPEDEGDRIAAGHRLVWSLFADAPDRERDFLWRQDGGDTWRRTTFLVLSRRPPENRTGLFAIETKPFSPSLRAGQRLRFRLRASPGASDARPGAARGKRVDPVARALRDTPARERAETRHTVLQDVGAAWLARQGAKAGFSLIEDEDDDTGTVRPLLRVDGDDWRSLPRRRREPVRFSVLDFHGMLEVTEPDRFLEALPLGFGRAKAFGCGLMLVAPG